MRAFAGEPDYGAAVQQTFARFARAPRRDYRVTFPGAPEAGSVEGQILDRVALLYGDVFARLEAFCTRHRAYLDPTLAQFDREAQFYLAYLAYVARFRRAGLPLCGEHGQQRGAGESDEADVQTAAPAP